MKEAEILFVQASGRRIIAEVSRTQGTGNRFSGKVSGSRVASSLPTFGDIARYLLMWQGTTLVRDNQNNKNPRLICYLLGRVCKLCFSLIHLISGNTIVTGKKSEIAYLGVSNFGLQYWYFYRNLGNAAFLPHLSRISNYLYNSSFDLINSLPFNVLHASPPHHWCQPPNARFYLLCGSSLCTLYRYYHYLYLRPERILVFVHLIMALSVGSNKLGKAPNIQSSFTRAEYPSLLDLTSNTSHNQRKSVHSRRASFYFKVWPLLLCNVWFLSYILEGCNSPFTLDSFLTFNSKHR